MRTTDLFKINRSSKRLNESLEKTFGRKIDFTTFDTAKLEDARNKLRTQISQVRGQSGFNETIENEALIQAQWMHDAIVAELMDRQEHIVDTTEVSEGSSDYVFNAIEDLRSYKPGLDKESFLDELYSYIDAEMGKMAADRAFAAGDDAYDEWYANYTDATEAMAFEKAPPGAKAERMVKHIKAGYAKDGKLTDKEKSIAYATAWKQHNKDKNESIETGEDMTKLHEGEIQQASAIVSAKTMVDRVGRWIEELSGMENDTLLQLGDQIRDEMSQEQAKSFISTVAPAIQQALETLKGTRETLATGVRTLTGEEQGAEMLGAEPAGGEEELGAAEPDAMNMGDLGAEEGPPEDEFAAAEPAAGGLGDTGREQRESIQRESIERQNRLLRTLAG